MEEPFPSKGASEQVVCRSVRQHPFKSVQTRKPFVLCLEELKHQVEVVPAVLVCLRRRRPELDAPLFHVSPSKKNEALPRRPKYRQVCRKTLESQKHSLRTNSKLFLLQRRVYWRVVSPAWEQVSEVGE